MIRRILNIEETNYTTTLNLEGLRKKIEELFNQSTLNMEGKLIGENEFSAYDGWTVVGWNMPNLRRKAAYLKGKISKGEKETLINLKVKPNAVLPVFALLSALIGIVLTAMALSNQIGDQFYLFLGLAFLVLGIIYYPMSILVKNRLRNKVVKYLDLNKV